MSTAALKDTTLEQGNGCWQYSRVALSQWSRSGHLTPIDYRLYSRNMIVTQNITIDLSGRESSASPFCAYPP